VATQARYRTSTPQVWAHNILPAAAPADPPKRGVDMPEWTLRANQPVYAVRGMDATPRSAAYCGRRGGKRMTSAMLTAAHGPATHNGQG
jgi:hypothetical protein